MKHYKLLKKKINKLVTQLQGIPPQASGTSLPGGRFQHEKIPQCATRGSSQLCKTKTGASWGWGSSYREHTPRLFAPCVQFSENLISTLHHRVPETSRQREL